MKNQTEKSIGILGGMGPQASAHLLKMLIDTAASEFGAQNGNQFPEIVLMSLPIEDFISDRNKAKKALKILKNKIKFFDSAKVNSIAIACNTAHILLPQLKILTKTPFVSIIDKVSDKVFENKIERIGILSTPMTIKSNLYQKALRDRGISLVIPTPPEFKKLEIIIRNVISGDASSKDTAVLNLIAENIRKRGAEGIILGCTELSLIFSSNSTFPVFDSLKILSRSLLHKVYE